MIKSAPISFHSEPLSPRIEMCGDTTLFPVDLPLLFGDEARRLPRLCRAEISTNGEPSASVYFAPVPTGGGRRTNAHRFCSRCALLYRYIAARQQVAFEDVPREVDCCFKTPVASRSCMCHWWARTAVDATSEASSIRGRTPPRSSRSGSPPTDSGCSGPEPRSAGADPALASLPS